MPNVDLIMPIGRGEFKEGFIVGSQTSYGYTVWFNQKKVRATSFNSFSDGEYLQSIRSSSTANITVKAKKDGYFLYGGPSNNGGFSSLTKKYFHAGETIISYTHENSVKALAVIAV